MTGLLAKPKKLVSMHKNNWFAARQRRHHSSKLRGRAMESKDKKTSRQGMRGVIVRYRTESRAALPGAVSHPLPKEPAIDGNITHFLDDSAPNKARIGPRAARSSSSYVDALSSTPGTPD
ncbi:unnamed protein product [Ixodes persulcatus]